MVMIIGSDETLKGDTFGGLVVCAVRLDEPLEEQVRAMGVRDSKRLSDVQIELMAQRLMELVPYAIRDLKPEEYNKEISNIGMTSLLNKLHTQVLAELDEKGARKIVDQYPGCKVVGAECLTKAEDQFISVAAASIIARHVGVTQFRHLCEEAGMNLPLGSTHVQEALLKLKAKGVDMSKFAKTSFKNVRAVLEN